MRYILFSIVILLFTISCTKEQEVPRIDYSETESDILTIEDAISDTTKTIVATLPLNFDSTNVLIQPSGLININEVKSGNILSRLSYPDKKVRGAESDFYSNGIHGDELSGKISNIYFDDLTSNTQHLLTNKLISIYRVIYLRKIAKSMNKNYLLYFVYDKDTNRDGKLDSDDISSIYISKLEGTEFKKITSDNHELMNSQFVPLANRYYFTTIEDINKDGHFGKEDKFHYYYIDFSTESYKVTEYNPIIN